MLQHQKNIWANLKCFTRAQSANKAVNEKSDFLLGAGLVSGCGARDQNSARLPAGTEALPRLIVLGGGVQPVVSRHACVKMVEEASSSKRVLCSVRLEDEDVNFSAAKVIRHFEGEGSSRADAR